MPIDYKFFNDPALVFIRYYGHITADELIEASQRFALEPDFVPGQPHFFDMSQITSYDIDFPKFLAFMANLAEIYPSGECEQLFVFYAPEGKPAEMADMARKPWEGSSSIFIRVAHTRDQAFDILGGERSDVLAHIEA
ncbi:hypothetical protein [Pseudophaeobacter arcticus]|uniref:hypothetical protein n=1 Tax=Pseudophaeobacter arcticus TaxID=385492 RepID=UPI0024916076|nr:hypothetical protein [Pseudophaeobacter arcticus]